MGHCRDKFPGLNALLPSAIHYVQMTDALTRAANHAPLPMMPADGPSSPQEVIRASPTPSSNEDRPYSSECHVWRQLGKRAARQSVRCVRSASIELAGDKDMARPVDDGELRESSGGTMKTRQQLKRRRARRPADGLAVGRRYATAGESVFSQADNVECRLPKWWCRT